MLSLDEIIDLGVKLGEIPELWLCTFIHGFPLSPESVARPWPFF